MRGAGAVALRAEVVPHPDSLRRELGHVAVGGMKAAAECFSVCDLPRNQRRRSAYCSGRHQICIIVGGRHQICIIVGGTDSLARRASERVQYRLRIFGVLPVRATAVAANRAYAHHVLPRRKTALSAVMGLQAKFNLRLGHGRRMGGRGTRGLPARRAIRDNKVDKVRNRGEDITKSEFSASDVPDIARSSRDTL